MEQIASLCSCLDNDGNFDPAKVAQYQNQRCQYFDEDEEEEVVVLKKRKFAHRHYEGYDPQSALCSEWYKSYVKYPEKQRTVTFHTLFRRRFRMPYKSYRDIVAEARNDDWFPSYVSDHLILSRYVCSNIVANIVTNIYMYVMRHVRT